MRMCPGSIRIALALFRNFCGDRNGRVVTIGSGSEVAHARKLYTISNILQHGKRDLKHVIIVIFAI